MSTPTEKVESVINVISFLFGVVAAYTLSEMTRPGFSFFPYLLFGMVSGVGGFLVAFTTFQKESAEKKKRNIVASVASFLVFGLCFFWLRNSAWNTSPGMFLQMAQGVLYCISGFSALYVLGAAATSGGNYILKKFFSA